MDIDSIFVPRLSLGYAGNTTAITARLSQTNCVEFWTLATTAEVRSFLNAKNCAYGSIDATNLRLRSGRDLVVSVESGASNSQQTPKNRVDSFGRNKCTLQADRPQ
jgi:hypothetical protein